jgi:hypothetical protein
MAARAYHRPRRDLSIVAAAAEFTVGYFRHGDVICPRSHLESQLLMTDVAAIMGPVQGM